MKKIYLHHFLPLLLALAFTTLSVKDAKVKDAHLSTSARVSAAGTEGCLLSLDERQESPKKGGFTAQTAHSQILTPTAALPPTSWK